MHYSDHNAILAIIVGVALVFFASSIRDGLNAGREKRLAQLKDGAAETFFEERRQLEAYPVRRTIILRLLGFFLAACGVASLLL